MKDYPEAKGLVFYMAEQEMVIDEIKIIPVSKSLKNLSNLLLLKN